MKYNNSNKNYSSNKSNKGYGKNKKGFIEKNEFLENINYFEEDGYVRADLFSEVAKSIVDYIKKGRGKISSSQIRKFYEEVINLKEQLENKKDFKMILPYFKMLKAKAHVAYQRDVINVNFKTFIEKNVDYVDDENKFKIFCTFFEAVVAYAKGTIKD